MALPAFSGTGAVGTLMDAGNGVFVEVTAKDNGVDTGGVGNLIAALSGIALNQFIYSLCLAHGAKTIRLATEVDVDLGDC